MKKILALLVACMMLITVFAGCGTDKAKTDAGQPAAKSEEAKKEEPKSGGKVMELAYWTLFGGGDGEFMQNMIDNFNKSQSEIKVNNLKLEWGEYYTKLMTAVAAGKGPDIGVSHTSKLPEMVEQGLVYELDEFAQPVGVKWEDFNQNILSATIFDGKHYAVPVDTHPFVFYYNKKLLKPLGVLDDNGKIKADLNGEGFIKFLTEIKGKLPEGVAPLSLAQDNDDPFRLWYALYFQQGAKGLLSADLKKAEIDTDKAVAAAKYVNSLFYDHKVIPMNLKDFYQFFQQEKAATFMSGVWCTGIWEGAKMDFGAMPLPRIFDKEATWGDSHTLVLPVTAKKENEKLKAGLKFLNFVADSGALWAKAGHIPAKDTVVKSDEFKQLPFRGDYVSVASNVAFMSQSTKNWAMNDAMKKNLNNIWANKVSPEEGIRALAEEIDKIVK